MDCTYSSGCINWLSLRFCFHALYWDQLFICDSSTTQWEMKQITSSDGAILRTKNICNSRGPEDYDSWRRKVGQKSFFFSPMCTADITNCEKLLKCEHRNKVQPIFKQFDVPVINLYYLDVHSSEVFNSYPFFKLPQFIVQCSSFDRDS